MRAVGELKLGGDVGSVPDAGKCTDDEVRRRKLQNR
jgi:hypothetical protein